MAKVIALTGASGVMGGATLELLVRNKDIEVKALVRPSKKNRKIFRPLDSVNVIWGDLCSYDDVRRLVEGADMVLHIGGMVSPAADWFPEKTLEVNVLAMDNIIKAVKSLNRLDMPVIYIGSVAQTGDRDICNRFGRTGDPIAPARFDSYAMSKCKAELLLSESGLERWASLRQSGILHPKLLTKANDPIAFHVPINGMLEWATVEDSAMLMYKICTVDIPEEFWKRYYNISSGKEYRLTNYEFEKLILKAIGAPAPEKIFETNWFSQKNFHGHWYVDADVLEEYFSFREHLGVKEYFRKMASKAPSWLKLSGLVPAFAMKMFMRYVACNPKLGTLHWVKSKNMPRIEACWGSLETYNAIPSWDGFGLSFPDSDPNPSNLKKMLLDHGYDDSAPLSELTHEVLCRAASFRGGKVLSSDLPSGLALWDYAVEWECADGHRFKLTPRSVLLGGYWCPECMENPDDYPRQARNNKFLAQVVAPLHD